MVAVLSMTTPLRAQQHTAQEWYEIIRQEVLDHHSAGRESAELHDIRVGMAANNLTFSHCELTDAPGTAAWNDFRSSFYDAILSKILGNQALTQDEERYRPIVLGYYGITNAAAVESLGRSSLFKGWKGETMTRLEADYLFMYRSSLISGSVGEPAYYPVRWYHHPYTTPRSEPTPDGLGVTGPIKQANVGRQYHDFNLRTYEATRESPLFDDTQVEPRDLWAAHFRMETQLDYLGIAAGYEPVSSGATTRYLSKESDLELEPGDDAADFVRLSERLAEGPVVLWLNDPVDSHPYEGMLAYWEYFYQAYRGKIQAFHVPTIIHDRCLPSGKSPKQYSGGSYNTRPWQWPWGREEQARRIDQRFLEQPCVSYPVLIDDAGLTTKNNYAAPGGINTIYLIDRNGVMTYVLSQADLNGLDMLEQKMIALLENDGVGTDHTSESQNWVRWGFPSGEVLLCGWVQSVSGSEVRVKRLDEPIDNYHGLRLYKNYTAAGVGTYLNMKGTDKRMAAVEAWESAPGKVYTFTAPGSITYDGRAGRPVSSLNAGDFIAVQYAGDDENDTRIAASYMRATGTARTESDDVTAASTHRGGPKAFSQGWTAPRDIPRDESAELFDLRGRPLRGGAGAARTSAAVLVIARGGGRRALKATVGLRGAD